MIRSNVRPTHPGVYIKEDILAEFGLSQQGLADRLGVTRKTISALVNERQALSANMAIRLGMFTQTSPEFWLNLQEAVDLWEAGQDKSLPKIKPFEALAEA
ncbi:MAG: HigA family addiction module antitoxin [bacterium]|nr:HigA family addiction module antitoxin [bacterium]